MIYDEIDSFDSDFTELVRESSEIRNLCEIRETVSEYGLSQTSFKILNSAKFLTTTSYDSFALENFSGNTESLSKVALEELDNKINEKSAGWAAKILSFVKMIGSKTLAVIDPIWDKLSGMFKKIGSSAWDKTKSVGKAIKAHPYKTIMLVILAIAAVGGILAYCGSFLPGSNQAWSALGKFDSKIGELSSKIKLPWGKVNVTPGNAKNLNHIDVVFASKSAESIPIEKLGWSQSAARTCYTELSKSITSFKSGLGSSISRGTKVLSENISKVGHAVVPKLESAFKGVGKTVENHTGSKTVAGAAQMVASGAFFWGAVNIFHKLWRLIKKIVIGGLRLIYTTIKALFDFS